MKHVTRKNDILDIKEGQIVQFMYKQMYLECKDSYNKEYNIYSYGSFIGQYFAKQDTIIVDKNDLRQAKIDALNNGAKDLRTTKKQLSILSMMFRAKIILE